VKRNAERGSAENLFRGLMASASLKPWTALDIRSETVRLFRGLMASASLKPVHPLAYSSIPWLYSGA